METHSPEHARTATCCWTCTCTCEWACVLGCVLKIRVRLWCVRADVRGGMHRAFYVHVSGYVCDQISPSNEQTRPRILCP